MTRSEFERILWWEALARMWKWGRRDRVHLKLDAFSPHFQYGSQDLHQDWTSPTITRSKTRGACMQKPSCIIITRFGALLLVLHFVTPSAMSYGPTTMSDVRIPVNIFA